uniref:Uncharacterized protein n=1 Tax=Tetradesmus obliquus TaxID=3088 RepID=A0A383VLZ6_TETOB|eukprot:jgi/Sobl393_1/14140/SZX65762.1
MKQSAGAVLLLLCLSSACWSSASFKDDNIVRVEVDIFVMSKCPDALFAESALAPVLQELKDSLSINMHFIGQKQDDGTFSCKHGPTECAGNLQQLCVQLHSKWYQRYDWLYKFVLCENKQGIDAIGTFTTAASCLKEIGMPVAAGTKMMGCMYGPGHDELLQQDMHNTAALGVATSATIQVDGNTICVRDGGEWKDCPAGYQPENFKEIFCATIASKNRGRLPKACKPAVPTPLAEV